MPERVSLYLQGSDNRTVETLKRIMDLKPFGKLNRAWLGMLSYPWRHMQLLQSGSKLVLA